MNFQNFLRVHNYLTENNYNFYAYNAKYNNINCDVLVSTDKRDLNDASFIKEPMISLEFIKNPNRATEDSIIIIVGKKDLSEIVSNKNFYNFFNIKRDNNTNNVNFKEILNDFLKHMDKQIPYIIDIDNLDRHLRQNILNKINRRHTDGDIFFNLMRNPNGRSEENNEKAKLLVDPIIFNYFENKTNYSFCFTDGEIEELTGNTGLNILKKRIAERK